MTGYTVHTGSTLKFAGGWDRIFAGKKGARSAVETAKGAAGKGTSKSARSAGKKVAKKVRRAK
jgi:hypothetical protein